MGDLGVFYFLFSSVKNPYAGSFETRLHITHPGGKREIISAVTATTTATKKRTKEKHETLTTTATTKHGGLMTPRCA